MSLSALMIDEDKQGKWGTATHYPLLGVKELFNYIAKEASCVENKKNAHCVAKYYAIPHYKNVVLYTFIFRWAND